jgi:undecaprenyl pyrophosphate phosphatase UppP
MRNNTENQVALAPKPSWAGNRNAFFIHCAVVVYSSLYKLAQYNEHLEANRWIETSVYSAPALVFALLFVSNQGYSQ